MVHLLEAMQNENFMWVKSFIFLCGKPCRHAQRVAIISSSLSILSDHLQNKMDLESIFQKYVQSLGTLVYNVIFLKKTKSSPLSVENASSTFK